MIHLLKAQSRDWAFSIKIVFDPLSIIKPTKYFYNQNLS